ncbi:hypothetical protein PsYK624_023390 [Phanerochaete sordida]|uniref:Uncharacterized protein n=1 Tax=Phanerochaete sordida TaxID=48140 RepID=A0A9P3L988_9APHY|nr:hypothetical protein PsYK624_023390 [Phanerochaete sordida]
MNSAPLLAALVSRLAIFCEQNTPNLQRGKRVTYLGQKLMVRTSLAAANQVVATTNTSQSQLARTLAGCDHGDVVTLIRPNAHNLQEALLRSESRPQHP